MGRPRCDKAPDGWACSRDPGHPGPCAAWPCSHETFARYTESMAQAFPPAELEVAEPDRMREGLTILYSLAVGFVLGLVASMGIVLLR